MTAPNHLLTKTQIACQTKLTRDGSRDMTNRKPYRSKALKAEARKKAFKTVDGYYVSPVRVLYHS